MQTALLTCVAANLQRAFYDQGVGALACQYIGGSLCLDFFYNNTPWHDTGHGNGAHWHYQVHKWKRKPRELKFESPRGRAEAGPRDRMSDRCADLVRLDASQMGAAALAASLLKMTAPARIVNAVSLWPAAQLWQSPEYLERTHGRVPVTVPPSAVAAAHNGRPDGDRLPLAEALQRNEAKVFSVPLHESPLAGDVVASPLDALHYSGASVHLGGGASSYSLPSHWSRPRHHLPPRRRRQLGSPPQTGTLLDRVGGGAGALDLRSAGGAAT